MLYVDTSDNVRTQNLNVGISFTHTHTQTDRHTDGQTIEFSFLPELIFLDCGCRWWG
jgi:hypothetical protein